VPVDLQNQLNQIADGLAEQGFSVIDHFLSDQEANDIVVTDEFKTGKLHFKKAGIGQQQNKQIIETIRGDYIQWIDPGTAHPALQVYLRRLKELMSNLNRSLCLSLKDFEIHKTVYPVGSFYKRHLDQFRADHHRKLSVICYLNFNWLDEQGGQLRMYLPEGTADIFPLSGRLVCFRSDQIEHEVLPATRERLSLTGWMVDQELG
jgi:SM-20-related protein